MSKFMLIEDERTDILGLLVVENFLMKNFKEDEI